MPRGSVVVRKSLGRQLKALRLEARKSAADVAESGVASTSKLGRIEAGDGAKLVDVWGLCRLYGADNETTDKLGDMVNMLSEKGWWEPFSDLMSPRFGTFVELEAAASHVLSYDGELVYGLLQTPGYHKAVTEADPDLTPELAERHLRLRAERQAAAFDRTPPLRVTAVVGEGAITRRIGGEKVIAEQRAHLLKLHGQANVQVLVLPWDAGAHRAMRGAFTFVGFEADEDNDVVYLETLSGGRYEDDAAMLQKYERTFDLIRRQSITIEEYLK